MSVVIDGIWCDRLSCGECGIIFYAPTNWVEDRRDKGEYDKKFHCPNGHVRIWRTSEIDLIRQERDRLKQREAQLRDEIAAEQAKTAKVERSKRRLEKRVANGVCPCCNRTFNNMARHMATQHPELAKPKAVA